MGVYLLFILTVFLPIGPEASEGRSQSLLEELLVRAENYSDKKPEQALYYAYSALTRAQQERNLGGEVRALSCLGTAYTNQGALGIGFEYFQEAYVKCPRNNRRLFALVGKNMACSYWKHKEFEKALEVLEPALKIAEEEKDSLALAECYNIEGLIYMGQGKKQICIAYWKKALEINRLLGNKDGIARNLNNICIYRGGEECFEMLREAIRINGEIGSTYGLAENYNNMGNQYYYREDYRRALECFDKARNYAQEFGARELLCDNYDYRIDVYRAMNNYREAFLCLQKLRKLENELNASRQSKEIASINSDRKYKMAQQQQELKKRDHEILQLKAHNFLMIVIFILILLLVCGGIYFRIKINKRKSSLQEMTRLHEMVKLRLENTEMQNRQREYEVSHYKQELSRFAYYIMNRNDLLEKIKSLIREIPRIETSEVKMYAKRINLFISHNQMEGKETADFVRQLEKINADFIVRLLEKHPDLSKNEKQLASMLRLDLSTKEIATLQGVEIKTISVARYRLRKRLELDSEQDLAEYMKSI